MRNLRNFRRSLLTFPEELHLTALAWDVANDAVICTFGPTENSSLIELKRWRLSNPAASEPNGNRFEYIASWDTPSPHPDFSCDQILSIHSLSGSLAICLVLKGGDIVIVRESPQYGEEKIEIVGTVDAGISAASWSPDEELLAILTAADTLLYMTGDFENVADVVLTSSDFQISNHVSVGWGKAETQFRGKGVKALRDPTMPEKVDQGLPSRYEDKSSTISWRGDGAFVAVNSLQSGPRRVIRVYTREGSLESVSEPVDGLEGALSWRPAGNLLAGIQRLEDRTEVIFFEKNGLRHGQFDLRLSKEETDDWGSSITLKWNIDSSVLAVCFKNRIQLWTMGNYHYYLKQEIHIPVCGASEKPAMFTWHPEKALIFTLGTRNSLQSLEYIFHVAGSSPSPPSDYGVVAVIDGKNLKLTPLRLANIPPPMALHELSLVSNAVDVAILEPNKSSTLAKIAVLMSTNIVVYGWNITAKPTQLPFSLVSQAVPSVKDHKVSACSHPVNQQIEFSNDGNIMLLQSCEIGSTINAYRFQDKSLKLVKSTNHSPILGVIRSISITNSVPHLFNTGGEVVSDPATTSSSDEKRLASRSLVASFPSSTYKIELVSIEDRASDPNNISVDGSAFPAGTSIAFGLTYNGALFANERCLTKDCTSFLLTPTHLIYTSTQHLLKFVHLAPVSDLEIPPDTPEADERCRSIERGTKLVTVIPTTSALVLQMPRGNLETIYPRALVLAGIRRSINSKKYKNAFLACRSHRVDMNILHDHAPQDFIADVALFLDQVQKVEHIDLFLSQLREEDVSQIMYKETLKPKALNPGPKDYHGTAKINSIESKVNRICNAILGALQLRRATNLQNVISAHVCKNPPDLEAGLLVIADLQRNQPNDAERAVEHICFLADVNRLYDNALGLYELDLVLLVVQQSQKDPREYLPFLQKLQELPIIQRKYAIDDYLGRYNKALNYLHDLDNFETFKSYAAKHSLYEGALRLCRYDENDLKDVMRLYADHLLRESRYKESGIVYEFLNDYATASESYRLAHLWKESLSSATLVPLSDVTLASLARTLADSLIELKDYHAAATIHIDYLRDIESASRLFCKGYFFADAIRTLGLHKRSDLLEPVIEIGLVEGMATMTELLAECKAQINAQVPRLRELRIKKVEEPLAFFDGGGGEANGVDIPDNISLAATDASTAGGGTLFTRYTNRTGTVGTNATRQTSKNRRREERKRARGKKGSLYEEEYLVNSIGRLTDRVNAVGDEVGRLVVGLMRMGMRERAKAVEGAMVDVVALCRGCVEEVFPRVSGADMDGEKGKGEHSDDKKPAGAEGVVWDSLEEMTQQAGRSREKPVVKEFERLSLF